MLHSDCELCGGIKETGFNTDRFCNKCKFAGNQEKSLAQAIKSRDNKLVKEIEKKAKEGTIVRLM